MWCSLIWAITAKLGVTGVVCIAIGLSGVVCIAIGLYLYYRGRSDVLAKELTKRVSDLNQQKQKVHEKIEELEEEKSQLGDTCKISDINWCIDDNRWRLQDIEWEIRDTSWEITDRAHQRKTSEATFWTVLGAALLALAGLIFSVGRALIS